MPYFKGWSIFSLARMANLARHNVYSDAAWVFVSNGDNGLVEPEGFVVAIVEHDGGFLVRLRDRLGNKG